MWTKPWGFKEGIAIGCGLLATGFVLQATLGRIEWAAFAMPVNLIALSAYLILLVAAHLLRHRLYLFQWLSTYPAAVSALAFTTLLTVAMGLIRQLPSQHPGAGFPGFSQMLSQWSFVLSYIWLVTSLGLTILRAGFPFRWSKIPFWLNHAGLFIAIVCATIGNADMQRLKMTTQTGKAEWRAFDDDGNLHELPLAIELQQFTIDEYPPKLMLIDNASGKALPAENPSHILIENDVKSGLLADWQITIEEVLPLAASVTTADTVRFSEFHSLGATTAALVKAVNAKTGTQRHGWVSCGSFIFPYKALRLDETASLVMPDLEPQRFASAVTVYTERGKVLADTIEVNRPLEVDGWKIYQLSYDETKGKWSDISIFELVRDPWLPFVYAGIWMLVAGAACLFLQLRTRKEETPQ